MTTLHVVDTGSNALAAAAQVAKIKPEQSSCVYATLSEMWASDIPDQLPGDEP